MADDGTHVRPKPPGSKLTYDEHLCCELNQTKAHAI